MRFCYSTFSSAGSRRTKDVRFTGTIHDLTVDVSSDLIETTRPTYTRLWHDSRVSRSRRRMRVTSGSVSVQ